MISEFILAVMLLTLFIFGIKIIINKDKYEILWIGSKIITIDEMLNNNIIKQPIYLVHYNLVNKTIFSATNLNNTYDTYYFYLSNLENAHCKKNYKKCGILDTYNNSMCIPQNESCPIKQIIIYNITENLNIIENLNNTENLNNIEYSSTNIDSEILYNISLPIDSIVDLYKEDDNENRKFINRNNFILNDKIYQYFFNSSGKIKKNEDNDINKYGDKDTKDKIIKKIDEENNEDKTVINSTSTLFNETVINSISTLSNESAINSISHFSNEKDIITCKIIKFIKK